MANKAGVAVDSIVKTVFDKALTNDLKKCMNAKIKTAIGKSSKLEVDDNPKQGFSLTATLELTKDDKSKPVQLKATIAIAILGSGISAVTINLKTPGQADAGSNPDKYGAVANELVGDILDSMLPKAIKAMEAKAP